MELSREMQAANLRRHDEALAQKAAAWWTAKYTALALAGKLEMLADEVAATPEFAPTSGIPSRQTPRQFKTMAMMLAASYGHRFERAH